MKSPENVLAVLLILFSLTACAGANETSVPIPSEGPWRIVSSLPTRGSAAFESKQMLQAVDLAINEWNSHAGGRKVEHLALDGGSDENGAWSPAIESQNATLAANDPQVIAYIGPYTSGATSVALPLTNKAHLLTLGPTATWPGLTLDGWESGEPRKYSPIGERNYARLSSPDSRQGDAAARWASLLQLKKAYVLNDGSSYSIGLGTSMVQAAHELGISAMGQALLDQHGSDNLVASISKSGADFIFFAPSSVGSAINLATILTSAHSTLPVFVSDTAISDTFIDATRDTTSTWHFIFNGAAPVTERPQWQSFANKFEEAYSAQPTSSAAKAYDLTKLTLDALASDPSASREEIISKVLGTKNYEGANGPITFDEHGDVSTSRLNGYRIKNGRFVLERDISW